MFHGNGDGNVSAGVAAAGVAAASPPSHAGDAREILRESGTLPPHHAKAGRFRHTTRKRDASATPRESGTLPPHHAKAGLFRHTTRKRDASATPRESGTLPPPLSHMKVPNSLSVKSQNLSL